MSRLTTADGLVAPAVEASIAALELQPEDAALVRLARDYAAALDLAAHLADEAENVLARVDPDDVNSLHQLAALSVKVERQTVLASVGPKLLAALDALGATPAARSRRRVTGGGQSGESGLQRLRAARPGR